MPMRYRPSRRASPRCSATTRTVMAATASQEQRSSRVMVVLSVRWAREATTSSKSPVNRAPGRAHGTVSVRTRRQAWQASRRISASRYSRAAPRSRCRQRRVVRS